MPDKSSKRQEAKHLANIDATEKRVKKLFEDTIDSIFEKAGAIRPKGDIFSITDHPVLNTAVNAYLKQFHDTMVVEVENGIKDDWELSRLKHIDIVSSTYQGKELSDTVKRIVYDKHEGALEQFIQARANGLNLSDRVWNYTNQFRSEIEQGLYAGISQGMSAVRMAQEQKKYLREPDKLFRRVRDAGGKLKLSKAAQAYKPGRGVYRSSFKNALRMTRNQNNFAYRTADVLRWRATPFVLGYEVKLSNSHPKYDMCDRLAGKYPVSFIFKAWHISCICYSVPILASPDEFDKYEDAVLNGTADDFEFKDRINDMPSAAKAWIRDNKDKFDGSGPKPFWYKENFVDGDPAKGLKIASQVEENNKLRRPAETIRNNDSSVDIAKVLDNLEQPSYKKLNSDADKLIKERLNILLEEFPKAKIKWLTASAKGGTFASVNRSLQLDFNPKYFNDLRNFKNSIDHSVKSGHFYKGSSIQGVIDHEFAHLLTINSIPMKGFVGNTPFSVDLAEIFNRYRISMTESTNSGLKYIDNPNFVSKYSHNNLHEFAAESFAYARTPGCTSSIAKEVLGLINKYFK